MIALITLLATIHADPAAATWPQWRGPTRDGIVANAAPWPSNFDHFQKRWLVTDLGPSYSGPILDAKRVYTTETRDKTTEVVTAYDRKSGEKLWSQQWAGSLSVPFFAAANGSWIRSTPSVDGDDLFVAGIRDRLVCLNATNGEIRWSLDCMAEFKSPAPDFGCVCSPLVTKDAIYIQAGAGVLKVSRQGKVLWREQSDGGGMFGSAFSSPVLARFGDRETLIVQTRTKLVGLDPDSGKAYFSREIPSFRGMNILTPTVFASDAIFTSTYGGTTQLFNVATDAATINLRDGWKFKYEGNMTSPIVIDGHAYLFGKDQRAVCFNLKTGEQAWRSDKSFGKYWNLVANGNRILALDSRGILLLLNANPKEFEIVAQKKLPSNDTWAHIAVAGNEVVIRDLNGLTSYIWTEK
jgi:outer membrane protein assembly factor BamB